MTRLCTVEVQGCTASLYGQAGGADGRPAAARLAFLIKQQAAADAANGGLSIEGRSGDRELLAGLLEEMANQLA
jgi:hypothetical protein